MKSMIIVNSITMTLRTSSSGSCSSCGCCTGPMIMMIFKNLKMKLSR